MPSGQRVYAVGDIHGCLDLLNGLLQKIDEDDARRPPAETHILFLGDLIDRGPQSAQVVERLRLLKQNRENVRFLAGNHEEVFLLALAGDIEALRFFNKIGGRETLLSYGIDEQDYLNSDYPELLELFQARVPQEHIAFIRSFEDMIIMGDYVFVHAGVKPDRPLAEQRTRDLRWIRTEFLNHKDKLEKVVVHGHTISTEPELREHRIGLDTGAYASGTLTAMGFEGERRWPLSACGD